MLSSAIENLQCVKKIVTLRLESVSSAIPKHRHESCKDCIETEQIN